MQANKPAAPQPSPVPFRPPPPALGGLEYKLGSEEFAWHMQNPGFHLYKNKPKANKMFLWQRPHARLEPQLARFISIKGK